MILNESLFENYSEEWVEVDSKDVMDSDGFYTDYVWYTNGKKHIFMFGDSDLYEPDEDYADWEVEIYPGNEENAYKEAQEWFDNYKGFDDNDDLNESTIIEDESKIPHIVNHIFGDVDLPSNITEEEANEFNVNQAADYVYYREWEGDDRISPEAIEKLEKLYNNMFDNEDSSLNEDFSSSLPKWLVRYLENNQKIKEYLSNRLKLDLANMEYVKIPKNEIPTNGFHPLIKDMTKQLVYLLRSDSNENIVYLPGITQDVRISLDDGQIVKIENTSIKRLFPYIVAMGYIDNKNNLNSNSEKQQIRKNARKGALERGTGQYSYEYKEYPRNQETGRVNYNATPVTSIHWKETKNQDKSGYPLNPDKYKNMLDQADMHTYSRQYDRYTKKLLNLKNAIISEIQEMRVDKSIGNSLGSSNLNQAFRYFEDAIKYYERLQQSIERILSKENLSDEEKNKFIQDEFDGGGYFNSISDLREAIEDAWKELNSYKNSKLKLEESAIQPDVNSKKLQELAKKHNVDILSPMNNGDLRLSGAGADLMKFYQEASEKGLWEVDPSLYECNLKETLTMYDFPEFKEIAKEIGLVTAEDLERFKKEEIQPGESELDAIKRYKQELIDAGVDLSKLVNESIIKYPNGMEVTDIDLDKALSYMYGEDRNMDNSTYTDEEKQKAVDYWMKKTEPAPQDNLNEGVFKDLAIDLNNEEDFTSILQKDLVPAKKELYKLQDMKSKDSSSVTDDQIKKAEDKVNQIEAKLRYLNTQK